MHRAHGAEPRVFTECAHFLCRAVVVFRLVAAVADGFAACAARCVSRRVTCRWRRIEIAAGIECTRIAATIEGTGGATIEGGRWNVGARRPHALRLFFGAADRKHHWDAEPPRAFFAGPKRRLWLGHERTYDEWWRSALARSANTERGFLCDEYHPPRRAVNASAANRAPARRARPLRRCKTKLPAASAAGFARRLRRLARTVEAVS